MEATAKQLWAPCEDDDGVVGDGDDCGDEEDHEVAQHSETRTPLERVYVHSGTRTGTGTGTPCYPDLSPASGL